MVSAQGLQVLAGAPRTRGSARARRRVALQAARRTARTAAGAPCRRIAADAGSASGAHRRGSARERASSPVSTSSSLRPGARPVRLATRKTWVSTAIVGSPNATLSTTLAVLRPTPGRACWASRERGTSPPWRSTSRRQVLVQVLRLVAVQADAADRLGERGQAQRQHLLRRVGAREQAPRRLLTQASVACAERYGGQQLEDIGVLELAGRLRVARRCAVAKGSMSLVFMLGSGALLAAFASAPARGCYHGALAFEHGRIGVAAVRPGRRVWLRPWRPGVRRCRVRPVRGGRRERRQRSRRARPVRRSRPPSRCACAHVDQGDAVHRAGQRAQLAAGALRADHRVHGLGRTDDAVDRAGLDAQRAADAPASSISGKLQRAFAAVGRVQRSHGPAGQIAASRATPSAPPGGHWLMPASPDAMAARRPRAVG